MSMCFIKQGKRKVTIREELVFSSLWIYTMGPWQRSGHPPGIANLSLDWRILVCPKRISTPNHSQLSDPSDIPIILVNQWGSASNLGNPYKVQSFGSSSITSIGNGGLPLPKYPGTRFDKSLTVIKWGLSFLTSASKRENTINSILPHSYHYDASSGRNSPCI